ncbi:MAG: hypothetical protein JSR19_09285 [Proteobacteria bacterium]|nr:hypothetical protein [Pseudomonadota bacterium]HQR05151.1 BPSS1780 family membrane protein [Rhodocyclaceae bacterium]
MQARHLPARNGFLWLVAAFRLYRRNPFTLTGLTLSYLLVLLIFAGIPLLGVGLASLARPFLLLMVANGCRSIDTGESGLAMPDILLQGLREQRSPLLKLGGLYFLGSLLALMVSILLGGAMPEGDAATQADVALALLKMSAVALLLVELPFWFAPLLTGWGRVPAVKSLFFSFVSVFRNWRAFVVYGFSLSLILAAGGALLSLLLALFGGWLPAAGTLLVLILGLFISFVLTPVLMASVYLSYRDVFAEHA